MYQASRKPFSWGGLKGYQQLQAIAKELDALQLSNPQNTYLLGLKSRIEWVLDQNQSQAEDLQRAHDMLRQVANCLGYPPGSSATPPGSSQQVAQEMETLLQKMHPGGQVQTAQIKLLDALHKRWKWYGTELLYCYDIPGLPPDNLKLECLFAGFRRHQRRISGRKSTRELIDFGQAQLFFSATSQLELLNQIQQVPLEAYQWHRKRLASAEHRSQFFRRFHRDPQRTAQTLVAHHMARSQALLEEQVSVRITQDIHTL